MNAAAAAIARFDSTEHVTTFRHLAIQPSPQRHAERDMEHGGGKPQGRQVAGAVAKGIDTPVTSAVAINEQHLLHQCFVVEVRPPQSHFRIVQR